MRVPIVQPSSKPKVSILNKVAALVYLISGLMILLTCGQVVLLGKVPQQLVIEWLPPYQFMIGLLAATITAILLWKDHLLAISLAIFTLVLEALAIVLLLTIFHDQVTAKTLNTLALRILLMGFGLILMVLHKRKMMRLR